MTLVSVAKDKVDNSSRFAQRLASLMRDRRLKHRQLAEVAGVSKAAVGKWLRGTTPGAGELFKIARALGVPMESFFDAIPYVKPPIEALYSDPLATSVKHLSPDLRKLNADALEIFSTPQGREAFMQVWTTLCSAGSVPQGGQNQTRKQVLTSGSESVIFPPMKSELQELLGAARRLTESRGMKTRLAKDLGVPLPRVSDWLAGNYLPSGERALQLREWVHTQEVQQNQSPGSDTTPPGRKTRLRKSSHEQRKSGQRKR